MNKIKVLIVDDSALIRQLLTEILSRDPAIEVVGVAQNPLIAREKVLRLEPDVITLDVEMPQMDGLTFLEKLMRAHPLPVVMISSLTERGCDTTLRALELGAVDFVTKPRLDVADGTMQLADEIVDKVKAAARAKVAPPHRPEPQTHPAHAGVAAPPIEWSPSAPPPVGPRPARSADQAAGRYSRYRDGAAHAREFHALVRRPSGLPVPRARQGGGRRRPHIAGPRAAGAGELPHGSDPQRRRIPRTRVFVRPGQPSPALGGRVVPHPARSAWEPTWWV